MLTAGERPESLPARAAHRRAFARMPPGRAEDAAARSTLSGFVGRDATAVALEHARRTTEDDRQTLCATRRRRGPPAARARGDGR